MELVLVRHGQTEWSVTGQHTGRTDIPMTAAGVAQATRAAAAVRVLLGVDVSSVPVFSSPLDRAMTTARLVAGPDTPVTSSELLLEMDYGVDEGLTPPQIRQRRPGWDLWADGCPGGETVEQVGDRVDAFLAQAEAVASAGSGTVLVVAHGHLLRILAARAVGLPAERGQVFTLDTATVSVIDDVRGKRCVRLWNLDPALVTGVPAAS